MKKINILIFLICLSLKCYTSSQVTVEPTFGQGLIHHPQPSPKAEKVASSKPFYACQEVVVEDVEDETLNGVKAVIVIPQYDWEPKCLIALADKALLAIAPNVCLKPTGQICYFSSILRKIADGYSKKRQASTR